MHLDGTREIVGQSQSPDSQSMEVIVDSTQQAPAKLKREERLTALTAGHLISSETIQQISDLNLDPAAIGRTQCDLVHEFVMDLGEEIAPRSINTSTMLMIFDLNLVKEMVTNKLRQIFNATTTVIHDVSRVA